MKVIGPGFGRTGTTSLKAALETLGFGPCYHMTEVFAHPAHADIWLSAWRREPVDWDDLLGGYEAAVDWPACAFYEELMDRYPDAKAILSVRDPGRWYESTRTTIYELSKTLDSSAVSRVIFGLITLLVFGGFAGRRSTLPEDIIWQGTFDGRFEDRRYAIAVFERHNEEVRRRVPPDRLLVYDVREGWGPLCAFLGVPEPEGPFPRLNDAARMRRGVRVLHLLTAAAPVLLALPVVLALALFGRRVSK